MLTKNKVYEVLHKLYEISIKYDNLFLEDIKFLQKIVEENKYRIVVIGEFSVGKSTFLNALIGERILYSSNNEATGTIITIQNGTHKIAKVHTDNPEEINKIKVIELDNNEKLNEIVDYMNINNKKRVSRLEIIYPMKEFGEDIIFIDTPGFSGISQEQVNMTKEIINEANAIIMLISHKGLEETELDIISGRNTEFGKIPSSEIILVINQIGRFYNNERSEEEAKNKIKQIQQEVDEELKINNFNDIKVFPVDSKDYLWGKDKKLYSEVLDNQIHSRILSQEEYIERSNFIEFKQYLFEFLDEGEKNKNFLKDINNKLNILLQKYISEFEKKSLIIANKNEKMLNDLIKQKIILLENRKNIIVGINGYFKSCLYAFLDSVKKDVETLNIDKNTKLKDMIDTTFTNKSDFNDTFFDLNMETCISYCKNEMDREYDLFRNYLIKQKDIIINQLINKKFYEYVKDFIYDKVDLKFDVDVGEITFECSGPNIEYNSNSKISSIENELKIINKDIKNLKYQIEKTDNTFLELKIRKLLSDKEDLKNEYIKNVDKLGQRPKSTPIYKKVEELKGWFIFKKKVEKIIKNGSDFSECVKWDKKKQNLYDIYIKEENKIDLMIENYKNLLKERNELLNKQAELKNEVNKMQKEIEEIKQQEKYQIELDYKKYMQDKKKEIFNLLNGYIENCYYELIKKIEEYICKFIENFKDNIKNNINKFLDDSKIRLQNQIDEIKKEIEKSDSDIEKVVKYIRNIKAS